MQIDHFQYFPLLKTTDAELKAYANLDATVKDGILPVFELTKSRRTKKDPTGKISKRVEQLAEFSEGRPFILDLTTEPTLSNTEIAGLLNASEDGYREWRDFVGGIENVIPVIHYNENASEADNIKQVQELEKQHSAIAFRADAYDDEMKDYFDKIANSMQNPERLITLLDVGYVPVQSWQEAVPSIKKRLGEIAGNTKLQHFVSLASSFPKTVIATGYGADDTGQFSLVEIDVFEDAKTVYPNLKYGDYGSIHPVRYPMGGGGWIPRIDAPLDTSCFYHRQRAAKGKIKEAYVEVAKTVVADKRYKTVTSLDAWGDDEIKAAAKGEPNGKSPSHWISVRANLHITRQFLRTKAQAV